jgi:hypothetical protein
MNSSAQKTSQMRRYLTVVGVLLAVSLSTAADAKKRTPFGYAADAPPPAAAPTNSALDRIEFRGVMKAGDDTLVVLFDTTKSRSTVLKLDETVDGLKVTDYQSENDRVRVESGSEAKWVELREAKVIAAAIPPPQQTANAGQQPGRPTVAANGQPANTGMAQVSDDEVRKRMQRVAEEIRRRRALRRQALQEAQQQQNAAGQQN